jgi:hypothetical protein
LAVAGLVKAKVDERSIAVKMETDRSHLNGRRDWQELLKGEPKADSNRHVPESDLF